MIAILKNRKNKCTTFSGWNQRKSASLIQFGLAGWRSMHHADVAPAPSPNSGLTLTI
jgi:hypothetical protein